MIDRLFIIRPNCCEWCNGDLILWGRTFYSAAFMGRGAAARNHTPQIIFFGLSSGRQTSSHVVLNFSIKFYLVLKTTPTFQNTCKLRAGLRSAFTKYMVLHCCSFTLETRCIFIVLLQIRNSYQRIWQGDFTKSDAPGPPQWQIRPWIFYEIKLTLIASECSSRLLRRLLSCHVYMTKLILYYIPDKFCGVAYLTLLQY